MTKIHIILANLLLKTMLKTKKKKGKNFREEYIWEQKDDEGLRYSQNYCKDVWVYIFIKENKKQQINRKPQKQNCGQFHKRKKESISSSLSEFYICTKIIINLHIHVYI